MTFTAQDPNSRDQRKNPQHATHHPAKTAPAGTIPVGKRRMARALTEVLAPWVLIATLLIMVGWHADQVDGALWGLFGAACASLGPMAWIVAGVVRGRYTDHHLTNRGHRIVPLIVSLILVIIGLIVLFLGDSPREVFAAEAAMLGGLIVTTPLTAVWKVSFHTAVAAAMLSILTVVYGLGILATFPLLVAIGWSRVVLRHHTVLQVVAGAPIGSIAALLFFVVAR